jgi:hypothetical protein
MRYEDIWKMFMARRIDSVVSLRPDEWSRIAVF